MTTRRNPFIAADDRTIQANGYTAHEQLLVEGNVRAIMEDDRFARHDGAQYLRDISLVVESVTWSTTAKRIRAALLALGQALGQAGERDAIRALDEIAGGWLADGVPLYTEAQARTVGAEVYATSGVS